MDIKDYLHLYIGCECMAEERQGVIDGVSLSFIIDTVTIYFSYAEDDWCVYNDLSQVMPILRPLSDMTDKEDSELSDIQLTSYGKNGLLKSSARQTYYLLSKHFDLFGLIEAGLAIDKTKQVKP